MPKRDAPATLPHCGSSSEVQVEVVLEPRLHPTVASHRASDCDEGPSLHSPTERTNSAQTSVRCFQTLIPNATFGVEPNAIILVC